MAAMFAALGDENRLRIFALLSRRPHYGEELAELLNLNPATISHHLRKLQAANWVQREKQSPYVLYRLNPARLADAVAVFQEPAELRRALDLPSEADVSDRILRRLVDADGRFDAVPRQRRQRAVLLRWVASHFETGRIYPEREIHRILLQHHDDGPSLREALVDAGWFQRSGHVYRRVEEAENLHVT